MSEAYMKNEVKAKRSDNEQADSNDSDIALNGFLNLLDHDISNNPEKLVEVTEALTEELDEIIGDYQVDLDGKY
ncbi:type II toxin-antitoxin system PrlF family antitoxin [Vibrio parahaemolyticus]|uniref:type II toxin-antitoxin system PrlF family antitoxin n=1 Tax=Vibrio parahaemolyticus TaxID=670 RepID=UPI003D9C9CBD